MNNNTDNYFKINKFLALIILILIAGIAGWLIGRDSDTNNQTESNNNEADSEVVPLNSTVKSMVSYSLPDGWKEASCENNPESVYLIPAGANDANCGDNPSSPVKLSVDPGETKDCNELQNVSDVKKHICISLYINDMRSLKATTEYLESSSFETETNINSYYVDTGSSILKAEYVYNSDNKYQIGFDQLVNSMQAK